MIDKAKYIPVTNGNSRGLIAFDDIVYIEREGRRIRLVDDEDTVCFYDTLANVFSKLDERFIICVKGLIINMDKIKLLNNHNILFQGGQKITIGRDSFSKLKKIYSDYISYNLNREESDDRNLFMSVFKKA